MPKHVCDASIFLYDIHKKPYHLGRYCCWSLSREVLKSSLHRLLCVSLQIGFTTDKWTNRTNVCRQHGDGRSDIVFLKKWAIPGLFFVYFRSFQTNINTILQQINVKKCPSSIRRWDSNPWPSDHESPPINTRPGLPPFCSQYYRAFWTKSR